MHARLPFDIFVCPSQPLLTDVAPQVQAGANAIGLKNNAALQEAVLHHSRFQTVLELLLQIKQMSASQEEQEALSNCHDQVRWGAGDASYRIMPSYTCPRASRP